MFVKNLILAGVVALCPLVSQAADEIKPFDAKLGLWETTSTTEMSGMPAMPQLPPEALSRLSPEQRAQVEAMMKGRGGAGGPRTVTSKTCMTKDSLNRALALGQNDNSCTRKVLSSSSSRQEIQMTCNRDNTTMTGDMVVERVDAEHVKGSMTMKSTGDQPINMKMSFNTKWVSADCGDTKPLGGK